MNLRPNLLKTPSALYILAICLALLLETASTLATMPTQHADATASTTPLMLEDKHDNHDDSVTTLDMSSGSASVELGPVVVNEDGGWYRGAWIMLDGGGIASRKLQRLQTDIY